jgi:hypothetical protein
MPPDRLDPQSAAQYAIIAVALIMIGALLTTGVVSIEQRAVVLGGVFTALFAIAWRKKRKGPPTDDKDET